MQKYRPDIDGIRALAVLSVMLFHFNEKLLPAGFLGVDIFFVLSGYLITSNIYQQINKGNFSFTEFYNRRIKRLLPSLYLVLIFFTVLAYLVLLPQDILTLNRSLEKIVLFWANHHFAKGRDYFEPLSNENPFLHTWSLAIEEQFYFVWPILLFVLTILKFRLRMIVTLSIALTILSFGIASFLVISNYSTYSYYSFLTRYGELLIGAILAVTGHRFSKGSNWISLSAIIVTIASLFLMSNKSHFPGIGALPITIATAFLISTNSSYVHKFLSLNFLVFIGKISYQLYLWHWPFLAITRYITGQYELTTNHIILISIFTFLASYCSWKWIETPVRYNKASFLKTFVSLYLIPTFVVIILIKASPYFYFKSNFYENEQFNSYGKDNCHTKTNNCIKGDPLKKPKVFITGDSHTAHLNPFFDQLGKSQGWSSFVISGSNCSPIINFSHKLTGKDKDQCEYIKNLFINEVDDYEYVILASLWDYHFGLIPNSNNDPNFSKKLHDTLVFLQNKGKKVLIFSQIPRRTQSPKREELLISRFMATVDIPSQNTALKANTLLKKQIKNFHNIQYIDTNKYVSKFFGGQGSLYQNRPTYFDQHHLNVYGSTNLAKIILEKEPDFLGINGY